MLWIPLFPFGLWLLACLTSPPISPSASGAMAVVSVTIAPDTMTLWRGDVGRATCVPRNKSGAPLTNTCTWVSSDTTVAKPTSGTQTTSITARKVGAVTITARAGSVTSATPLRVTVRDTVSPAAATCVSSGTMLCPTDNLQAKVTAAGSGATLTLQPGVYRMQSVTPLAGQTIQGQPGAILSGAKVLTGWTPSGGRWSATPEQILDATRGDPVVVCNVGYERCSYPHDLWINGTHQRHAATLAAAAAGFYFIDYAASPQRVYVGNDPTGKTVELGVTTYAVSGSAANVTVEGLVIEKYANREQSGAVGGLTGPGSGWIVRRNEIRGNHGIGVRGGAGMQMLGNNIHHNGQMGYGGGFALIQDNTIAYNNQDWYNPFWEAGGGKAAYTTNLTVRNNWAHHNNGPGLWTDISNVGTLYEGNTADSNYLSGIFHEISYAAIIRNNMVRGNGIAFGTWVDGAGIIVSTSRDVEVYGNTVSGNHSCGILGLSESRGSGTLGLYELRNLYVHDNTITQPAIALPCVTGIDRGPPTIFTAFNNRWVNNTYHTTHATPFDWLGGVVGGSSKGWAQWQAAGFDLTGSFGP